MLTYTTSSEEETIALGKQLSQGVLPARGVVVLSGNLGAGKTTLAKGIAAGRGAAQPDEVSSPTFTLIHEYGNPASVYHVDLYRLESSAQAASLGLEEIFERDALVLVEWGDRFPELLPDPFTCIEIERQEEDQRRFRIRSAKAS